ncbi:MAG: hypothetical protein AYK19_12990 [Theionarchaea archaeon DG-70-1]|nr:MAG: hypothetical protein AYK19_12990 [Theionarchaea archaeon DG-70-1]
MKTKQLANQPFQTLRDLMIPDGLPGDGNIPFYKDGYTFLSKIKIAMREEFYLTVSITSIFATQ